MDISIATSDPDAVDPAEVARLLTEGNFFVLSVDVNEGERTWTYQGEDVPVTWHAHDGKFD